MNGIQSYEVPQTLADATAILATGEVTILAGGTDLMVQAEAGRVQLAGTLMNIRRVGELSGIEQQGEDIRIGALTTITELLENEIIGEHLPILRQAADQFASAQIRNVGTLGGNICNASPAGDTLVPLLVLDAQVELASAVDGAVQKRLIPLHEFLVSPGKTSRKAEELLTAIRVPVPAPDYVAFFDKFGTRPALDIATVSVGIGGELRDNRLHNARVGFGAVAPVPLLAQKTMAALAEHALDDAGIAAVAAAAKAEVNPIDDVRASAWYRKELICNLTKKVLNHVVKA